MKTSSEIQREIDQLTKELTEYKPKSLSASLLVEPLKDGTVIYQIDHDKGSISGSAYGPYIIGNQLEDAVKQVFDESKVIQQMVDKINTLKNNYWKAVEEERKAKEYADTAALEKASEEADPNTPVAEDLG